MNIHGDAQSKFSKNSSTFTEMSSFREKHSYIGLVFLFIPLEDKSGHTAEGERHPGRDCVPSFGLEKVFFEATHILIQGHPRQRRNSWPELPGNDWPDFGVIVSPFYHVCPVERTQALEVDCFRVSFLLAV